MATQAARRWLKRLDQTLSQKTPLNRVVLAWSVQAISYTETITIIKRGKTHRKTPNLFHSDEASEGHIIVCRARFLKLLKAPKSLRDQLVIELPTLMAFRTGEVTSARLEHVDFESGDMQVLDSKKYQLFLVPLNPTVAMHLAEYVQKYDIESGVLFQRPKAGRQATKLELSSTTIHRIWAQSCKAAGVPYMPPRMGRAMFSVNWIWGNPEQGIPKKTIKGLQVILRHDDILATEKYLNKIMCYEDIKAEFNQGLKSPFVAACARSKGCPLFVEGCHCRMFTPRIREETQQNE